MPNGGLAEGETVINLFEKADLSTFLHESGHFFLEAFSTLASEDSAPAEMKADLAVINKYLGSDGKFEVEHHEKWARSFEAYLMEGKAPSLELASAFSRFKSWLTRIYKTVAGLDVKVSDEIREVMDRMLATESQIAAAQSDAAYRPLFAKVPPPGMDEKSFKSYQRIVKRTLKTQSKRYWLKPWMPSAEKKNLGIRRKRPLLELRSSQ